MKVLGLDPSLTAFGWAVCDLSATGAARCPERGRFSTSSKMVEVDRYVHMREQLRALVRRLKEEHGITRVAVESPAFGSSYSEGMYALFTYTREALRLEKCDVCLLGIGQVKQAARTMISRPEGWKMDKPDMVEAARNDCGGKGRWNHNEADAYLVGRLGGRFWLLHDEILKPEDLTPVEHSIFLKEHTYTRGKRAGQTTRSGILHRPGERYHLWSTEDYDGEIEEG